MEKKCYCCSRKSFQDCCEPIIKGIKNAATAEELMRSRFSSYVLHEVDYLLATTHISQRGYHSKTEILNWASSNQWMQLEIIHSAGNTVEFKAYFLDSKLQKQIHHERSTFRLENERWFYLDGKFFN